MKNADSTSVNFLKMSLENAYNISLRKKIFKRDYAYIFSTCMFIFQFYEEFKDNYELEKTYHRAIELFSRVARKLDN